MMMRQLSLSIDERPDARIGDFAGPSWISIIDAVRQLHAHLIARLYIHGPADSGKSHLLSAICESYQDMNCTAIQVSLLELLDAPTEALSALESFDLVALDDEIPLAIAIRRRIQRLAAVAREIGRAHV